MAEPSELLTGREQEELQAYRTVLRKMPVEDLASEFLYHESTLEELGREALGPDGPAGDYVGWRIADHRRQRDACGDEMARRKRARTVPAGGIATAITPALIAGVKDRVQILPVIEGAGVDLKPRGREWVGLCPFHVDHSPSFQVNPDKGKWYCFACHAGGDVIAFVMRFNRWDFMQALRSLAEIAGVELPRRNLPEGDAEPAEACSGADSADGLNAFALTDAGNGEAFTRLYGESVRFDHRRKRWLIFRNGVRWQPDPDGEIERLAVAAVRKRESEAARIEDHERRKRAVRWAVESESRYRRRALLESAAIQEQIADSGENWDPDPWLIGCENGVVDLQLGELRPGKPEDRITLSTRLPYDSQAKAERWEDFLKEVFGDPELIAFVQRAVGYSLTGDTSEQILFMCYGSGANGKSVFLGALRDAFGDYAANTTFSTLEQSDYSSGTNDVAALAGRRLVTASEVRESARLNEARVKALTGGDPITARFLYGEFFTFKPAAKLWLAVNHKPRVSDDSYGFWRRIRLIPFTRTFGPGQANTHLSDILQVEADGILAWAVRGCQEWLRAGGLEPPESVQDATAEYQSESDPLADFVEERCTIAADAEAALCDLYQAYSSHAEEYGSKPMSAKAFGRRLVERGMMKTRLGDGRKLTYRGIGLLAR